MLDAAYWVPDQIKVHTPFVGDLSRRLPGPAEVGQSFMHRHRWSCDCGPLLGQGCIDMPPYRRPVPDYLASSSEDPRRRRNGRVGRDIY